MEQEKFSNEMPEQVVLVPNPRRIEINYAWAERAYGLFDTKTGTQVKDFVKGNGGKIEFDNLDPNMHYDVGVVENIGDMRGDEKPIFAIAWNQVMRDNTDEILKNSNNLPVDYPKPYVIKYKDGNTDGVYDIVDDSGETVGQVTKLSPQGDKPYIHYVYSFRMKDDTIN